MEITGLFGPTISILEKSADLRIQRHNLIAANVANIDTPHYRSFDIVVEEELQKITKPGETLPMARTSPGHLPGGASAAAATGVTPRADQARAYSLRQDGNSVDLDREMTKLGQNQLLYDAAMEILARKFEGLKNSIKGE
ncbi:MAG: flagellar basal body rod protein FlgB [Desulfobacterales bacterium]